MPYGIRKPNGHMVTLKTYCESWRTVKTLPVHADISGWEWYPVSAIHVRHALRQGMHDRINRRGKLSFASELPAHIVKRIHAVRISTILRRGCAWCGQALPEGITINPNSTAHVYCSTDCRRSDR